jgi:hypothetical protein
VSPALLVRLGPKQHEESIPADAAGTGGREYSEQRETPPLCGRSGYECVTLRECETAECAKLQQERSGWGMADAQNTGRLEVRQATAFRDFSHWLSPTRTGFGGRIPRVDERLIRR